VGLDAFQKGKFTLPTGCQTPNSRSSSL